MALHLLRIGRGDGGVYDFGLMRVNLTRRCLCQLWTFPVEPIQGHDDWCLGVIYFLISPVIYTYRILGIYT